MSFCPILPRNGADSNGNTITQQSDPNLRNPLKTGSSTGLKSSGETIAFSLPPLPSLTRMPGSMFSPLPPRPGPSESPELIQHWLRAKAEEDRRAQEVEKTHQEKLKLEQRKAEHDILNEALDAGIPPHMVPSIFASMMGAWYAQRTPHTVHGWPYAYGSAQAYSQQAWPSAPAPPTYYPAPSNPAQGQRDLRYGAPNAHFGTGPYIQPASLAGSAPSGPTGAFAPGHPQQPQGVPAQHQAPVHGTSTANVSREKSRPSAKPHSRSPTFGVLQPLEFSFWAPDHLKSQAPPNQSQKGSVVPLNASSDKGPDIQTSLGRIRESVPSPHREPTSPSHAFQQSAESSSHINPPANSSKSGGQRPQQHQGELIDLVDSHVTRLEGPDQQRGRPLHRRSDVFTGRTIQVGSQQGSMPSSGKAQPAHRSPHRESPKSIKTEPF